MAKAADHAYAEALQRKRIAVAKQIGQNLVIDDSIVRGATELYSEIIDGKVD